MSRVNIRVCHGIVGLVNNPVAGKHWQKSLKICLTRSGKWRFTMKKAPSVEDGVSRRGLSGAVAESKFHLAKRSPGPELPKP